MTYLDPLAALAPAPIIITLSGQDYTIPALPALDWLLVMMAEEVDVLGVIPGLLVPEDRALVEDRISQEEITWDEVNDTALEAMTVASGRDWWFAIRFLAVARVGWDVIGGQMARSGIDATKISLAAWIDAAYHIAREAIGSGKEGQQNLVRFTSELEAPPPGMGAAFDEEFEAAAFEQAVRMAQH